MDASSATGTAVGTEPSIVSWEDGRNSGKGFLNRSHGQTCSGANRADGSHLRLIWAVGWRPGPLLGMVDESNETGVAMKGAEVRIGGDLKVEIAAQAMVHGVSQE